MGGDGGVIAVQREFMRGTSNSLHRKGAWRGGQNYGAGDTGGDAVAGVDRRRVLAVRVRNCALSAERLTHPVVADELGNLYNKLALLSALSNRTLPERLSHIRGLRDLIDCKLSESQAKEDGAAEYFSGEDAPITSCPITGESLDGSKPFVVLRTGWIVSENALKSVGVPAMQNEYGPFTKEEVFRIAPEDYDQIVQMHKLMLERQIAAKERKKEEKKLKKKSNKAEGVTAADVLKPRASPAELVMMKKKKRAADEPLTEAARIAKMAKDRTKADRHNSDTINNIFHDDGGVMTRPEDLFITTASKRYNLN